MYGVQISIGKRDTAEMELVEKVVHNVSGSGTRAAVNAYFGYLSPVK